MASLWEKIKGRLPPGAGIVGGAVFVLLLAVQLGYFLFPGNLFDQYVYKTNIFVVEVQKDNQSQSFQKYCREQAPTKCYEIFRMLKRVHREGTDGDGLAQLKALLQVFVQQQGFQSYRIIKAKVQPRQYWRSGDIESSEVIDEFRI